MKRRLLLGTTCLGVLLTMLPVDVCAQKSRDLTTVTPIPQGEWLIVGFPGGVEKYNNHEQVVVRIADHLKAQHLPGVHIEVIENHHRKLAIELVRRALDHDGNGRLDRSELDAARVMLYGQSMGGAAVVKAARELDKLGVPIALTVQIDSVGVGDAAIPPNVHRAANLYQPNGVLIRGEKEIRAEDPAKTEILGNFSYDYSQRKIELPKSEHVKWYKRMFWIAHTKMEFDPDVWSKVEGFILAEVKR